MTAEISAGTIATFRHVSATDPMDKAVRENRIDSASLFEDHAVWEGYEANPFLAERTRLVQDLLPSSAETILDVGCGDGGLLRELSKGRRVFGVDPSRAALARFDLPRVCGLGEVLPFRSGSVDLVSCLEVLEHLPSAAVDACASELARVSRRWLLVATPDREDPLRNALRCPRCDCLFNRSHHVQSFSLDRIRSLFPGFDPREVRRGGQPVRPYPSPLLWARHHLARRYFKGPGETRGLCPCCGNRDFPRFQHNVLSLILDGTNRLISARRPYWIFLLLERRQNGRIGSGQ